jgi:hypothetical protein
VTAWPNPSYLLQRKITPKMLAEGPAYWRAFYVFGEVWVCWWNCFTDCYRLATDAERGQFRLGEVEELARKIAALTQMNFFSSEIAQSRAVNSC